MICAQISTRFVRSSTRCKLLAGGRLTAYRCTFSAWVMSWCGGKLCRLRRQFGVRAYTERSEGPAASSLVRRSSQVKKLSPGSYPGPSLRGKFFWLTEAKINSAITRDGSRCESRRLGPVLVIATQPGQRRHQLQHLDVQLLGQCLDHHLQQRRRQMSKLDFVKRRKLSSCTFLVPSVRFELTLDGF
jgi:hypothetical protein